MIKQNLKKIKEFQKIKMEVVSIIQKKELEKISNFIFSFKNEFCKLYLEISFANGKRVELYINEKEWGDTEKCKRWNYKQLETYFGTDLKNKIVSVLQIGQ